MKVKKFLKNFDKCMCADYTFYGEDDKCLGTYSIWDVPKKIKKMKMDNSATGEYESVTLAVKKNKYDVTTYEVHICVKN